MTHLGHPIQLFVRASTEEEAWMNVRYRVELSQTERAELTALLSQGKHVARKLKRAQILLAVDAGASDAEIARSVGFGVPTIFAPNDVLSSATWRRLSARRVLRRLELHYVHHPPSSEN
jgi:hypothetical protein